jgi:ribonuclease VapC
MNRFVLDASAVLALLNEEAGGERVEAALAGSMIGSVNYCEVLGKLIDGGMPEDEARQSVQLLGIEIIGFDEESARVAASLRLSTRRLGLSLGDRCCLALGLSRGFPVMTAERVWARVKTPVKVVLIR